MRPGEGNEPYRHGGIRPTDRPVRPLHTGVFRVFSRTVARPGTGDSKPRAGVHVRPGAAYFFQWKLTSDDLGIDILPGLDKARSYGLGPEATVAIPFRRKLLGILTARYFWDYGVRSTTEGETFVAMLTVPIPPISLNGGS